MARYVKTCVALCYDKLQKLIKSLIFKKLMPWIHDLEMFAWFRGPSGCTKYPSSSMCDVLHVHVDVLHLPSDPDNIKSNLEQA